MELQKLPQIEHASKFGRPEMSRFWVAMAFIIAIILFRTIRGRMLP